ncbi:MBL fold metallo-hydrolase [Halochromatium salexigens]|nr:MBL fold metallo-hydrolase [Halochromatium salexigens]
MSNPFATLCQSMFLFLLLPTAALATSEPAPIDIEMLLKQVSEHVYYAQVMAGIATDNKGFISNAAAIVTHYHADHIYGLQVFEDLDAEIIAPGGFQDYLDSPAADERLEERRFSLSPWVNEDTRLVRPDRVIVEQTEMSLGGVTLDIRYLRPAHSDGDLAVLVRPDQVLISGDIIFEGRIPFTGSANTGRWLEALESLDQVGVEALIPGHGPAEREPAEAVHSTLEYLRYTRGVMAEAVDEMTPFAEAYEAADWWRFERLPAFAATHRRNAYGIYLSLEQEIFGE